MRSTGSVEQPIELLSGLTNLSKYPINFSLVATLELTLQYIDNRGAWRPLNSIFSNQFKRITRVKSRVFVLKGISIEGPGPPPGGLATLM